MLLNDNAKPSAYIAVTAYTSLYQIADSELV